MCPDRFTEVGYFMHRKHAGSLIDADLSLVSRIVCFSSFASGCVVGALCGSTSFGSASVVVKTVVDKFPGYISVNDISSALFFSGVSLLAVVFAFVSSFFLFGFLSVPVILFCKAFSFSYVCASLISCGGTDLFKLFIICSLCDVLVFIPVCVCISIRSFECSIRLFGKVFRGRAGKAYDLASIKTFSVLLALTAAALAAQLYLIPLLAGPLSAGPLRNIF